MSAPKQLICKNSTCQKSREPGRSECKECWNKTQQQRRKTKSENKKRIQTIHPGSGSSLKENEENEDNGREEKQSTLQPLSEKKSLHTLPSLPTTGLPPPDVVKVQPDWGKVPDFGMTPEQIEYLDAFKKMVLHEAQQQTIEQTKDVSIALERATAAEKKVNELEKKMEEKEKEMQTLRSIVVALKQADNIQIKPETSYVPPTTAPVPPRDTSSSMLSRGVIGGRPSSPVVKVTGLPPGEIPILSPGDKTPTGQQLPPSPRSQIQKPPSVSLPDLPPAANQIQKPLTGSAPPPPSVGRSRFPIGI